VNVSDSVPCPACGDLAEPEQDDDLTYYACVCGYEFGYQRVVQDQDSSCQLGIDEDTRRRGSVPDDGLPVLQIGRRPT
jgi:hypothetical protein